LARPPKTGKFPVVPIGPSEKKPPPREPPIPWPIPDEGLPGTEGEGEWLEFYLHWTDYNNPDQVDAQGRHWQAYTIGPIVENWGYIWLDHWFFSRYGFMQDSFIKVAAAVTQDSPPDVTAIDDDWLWIEESDIGGGAGMLDLTRGPEYRRPAYHDRLGPGFPVNHTLYAWAHNIAPLREVGEGFMPEGSYLHLRFHYWRCMGSPLPDVAQEIVTVY
jgi:hypothetical protein